MRRGDVRPKFWCFSKKGWCFSKTQFNSTGLYEWGHSNKCGGRGNRKSSRASELKKGVMEDVIKLEEKEET